MISSITKDIIYVGVNDHDVDLFEGQYIVPNGMAYNSYVIMDERIAVMDTVDAHFGEEWLSNVKEALNGREPDYLVVQHMEPDHSANVANFVAAYPNAKIVGNAKTFAMIADFFDITIPEENKVAVANGESLSLGAHQLTFVFAPMVHWPEVMVTYESSEKVLFSADGFGKFGALSLTENADWACEARRYYFGIVGKYGAQVRNLLKKAAAYEIEKICPLHGPVLSDNIGYYINLYDTWSSYRPESDGVVIAYASVYGGTESAAKKLGEMLKENGCEKVVLTDLTRDDMAEAIEDAFRYDSLVLCAASYAGGVFPPMEDFLNRLSHKAFQKRKVGIIENGSWAPCAAKSMKAILDTMKNLEICDKVVTIKTTMKDADVEHMKELAKEIVG